VTPPGGSRDDPEAGEPPATATAEPGDDDPKLSAMRAVWLSMRDEDPPDRGLAELLAAARSQAEAMTPRPSWWQRVLAGMRRPPVLALATALVLVAGAVIIGRRTADDASEVSQVSQVSQPPARPASEPALPATATAVPEAAAAAPDLRVARDVPVAVPAPTPPAAVTPPPPPSPPVSHSAPPPANRREPAPARKPPSRPIDPESPYDGGPRAASGKRAPAHSVDDGDFAGSKAVRSLNKAPGAQPASLGPLYQQCEAAARRGDCPTVRRLVEQIARSDRDYPARAARDAAIARCLAD